MSRAETHARVMALLAEGLSHRLIAERLGYHPSYVEHVIREGVVEPRLGSRRALNKQAPPRDADYDVSGADGVRFVVIPVSCPGGLGATFAVSGVPGWTVFDTAGKRRAGPLVSAYWRAHTLAEELNAAEELAA